MALRDFKLERQTGGLYRLTDPSEDPSDRMKTRFTLMFLSSYDNVSERGSLFEDRLRHGELTSNAAIVSTYGVAAQVIKNYLRTYSQEYTLLNSSLLNVAVSSTTEIALSIELFTEAGSTTVEIDTGG